MKKLHIIIITIIIISLLIILYRNSFSYQTDITSLIFKKRKSGEMDNYIHQMRTYNSPNLLFKTSFNKNNIERFNKELNNDDQNHILTNAITNNPVNEVLLVNSQARNIRHKFSHKIKPSTKITDQKKSGRCWVFSFLNMFRYRIIQEYHLPNTFEFSQTYLYFFDKLEKCYYFLQNIIMTRTDKVDDRTIDWMLKSCLSDGGNWNMLMNLINKYGIVPKDNMPETFQSNNTHSLNMFLRQNLRRMAYAIRSGNTLGLSLQEYIQKQSFFIYKLLVIFLGSPPTTFSWEVYNKKSEKLININNLTPLKFTDTYLKFVSNDWVVCGNFPIKGYPFYQRYNIKYCNNMIDGQETEIFNIPIDDLIQLAKKSLDKGQPVWIAVDWSKFYSCEYSSLDINLYDYKRLGYYPLDKGISLEYHMSSPNHAVLLIGYNENSNGKVDRWLVENSHGDIKCKLGKSNEVKKQGKGYVTMSTEWFHHYVYQIVIEKYFLNSKYLQYLNKPAIELEPWETIGCELLSVVS